MGTLLRELVDRVGEVGVDRYAARRGFPSTQAYLDATGIARRLYEGGAITSSDLAFVKKLRPDIPPAAIHQVAVAINNLPAGTDRSNALIKAFGFGGDMAQAQKVVARRAVDDFATDILKKRAGEDTRAAREAAVGVTANHVTRHNEDAATRRAELSRALAADDRPKSQTYSEHRGRVADDFKANTTRRREHLAEERRTGRELHRTTDIRDAMRAHETTDQALEMLQPDAQEIGEIHDDMINAGEKL